MDMERKYLLKSPFKVALMARLIAKGIDLFIVLLLVFFLYPFGIFLSILYLSLSDSLQNGQSIGKKIIGFRVICFEDGSPCSFKQSSIRNLPFLIPLGIAIFPIWGWAIGILMGISLIILELYLLSQLDSGHRLGDVMADTTVIACDPEAEKERRDALKFGKKKCWSASTSHGTL
jgi:uncharacterized RDD family membrane protein YckC